MGEITQDITPSINPTCCACLSIQNVKVFGDCNDCSNCIISIYKTFTNLQVDVFETICFCEICIEQIQAFYKFKEMCKQSYAAVQLLSSIKQTDQIDKTITLDVKQDSDLIEDSLPKLEAKLKPLKPKLRKLYLKCIFCSFRFSDEFLFEEHSSKTHFEICRCSICETKFNSDIHLTNHLSAEHDIIRSYNKLKIFGCGKCDQTFNSLHDLQVHLFIHLGLKTIKCELCQKQFIGELQFRQHKMMHARKQSFKCFQCPKKFDIHRDLKRHLLVHANIKRHKCNQCSVAFLRPYDLKAHLRIHTGERPYLCAVCGKSYKRAYQLTIHKRTHTGERPYMCSHCGKGFTSSGELKIHERSHTGEKPYSCIICNAGFHHKTGLRYHMIRHETGRFDCKRCGEIFKSGKSLKEHYSIHEELTNIKLINDSETQND